MDFKVEIQGLKELTRALKDYPKISAPILADAINKTLAKAHEITADDNIFKFQTPRALRTGMLQSSFGLDIKLASVSKLSGSIGPTMNYAPYVYFGARGTAPNLYMDRIRDKTQIEADKLFVSALDKITSEIAKQTNIR